MSLVTETLAGIGFFETLTSEELQAIAGLGSLRRFDTGTAIFRQGDPADCLYVIVGGEVEVTREDEAGHRMVVTRFGRGNYFGELALIDGDRRSATVTALCPCDLFLMGREAFLGFIARSPPLLSRLLSELSLRIRETTERLYQGDLERRLRTAEAEVMRHRSIAGMVTGLAHEINTPLGTCTTSASVIDDYVTSWLAQGGLASRRIARLREPVDLLVANLKRTVSLVQAFADVAANQHAERLQTVDLVETVADAVVLFGGGPPVRPLAFSLPPRDRPVAWRGYRVLLQRVLFHLFANVEAHAYGPGESARADIGLAETELDGAPAVAITVRDFGAGIPPAVLPRVFDAFFTTARGRGHKGLGLTIAFNTVTGPLNGRITLDSASGQGTAVTMILPAALEQPAAATGANSPVG